jgi:hypothetical protein
LFNYINSLHLDGVIVACRSSQEDNMAYKEVTVPFVTPTTSMMDITSLVVVKHLILKETIVYQIVAFQTQTH